VLDTMICSSTMQQYRMQRPRHRHLGDDVVIVIVGCELRVFGAMKSPNYRGRKDAALFLVSLIQIQY